MGWRHPILAGVGTAVTSVAVANTAHAPKFIAPPSLGSNTGAHDRDGAPTYALAAARPLTPWPSPFTTLADDMSPLARADAAEHRPGLLQHSRISSPELRRAPSPDDPTVAAATPARLPGPRTIRPDGYMRPPLPGFELAPPVIKPTRSPAEPSPQQYAAFQQPTVFGFQPLGPFDFGPEPVLIARPAIDLPVDTGGTPVGGVVAVPEPASAAILIAAPLLLLRPARRSA